MQTEVEKKEEIIRKLTIRNDGYVEMNPGLPATRDKRFIRTQDQCSCSLSGTIVAYEDDGNLDIHTKVDFLGEGRTEPCRIPIGGFINAPSILRSIHQMLELPETTEEAQPATTATAM